MMHGTAVRGEGSRGDAISTLHPGYLNMLFLLEENITSSSIELLNVDKSHIIFLRPLSQYTSSSGGLN